MCARKRSVFSVVFDGGYCPAVTAGTKVFNLHG